jgi:hypothetical protein
VWLWATVFPRQLAVIPGLFLSRLFSSQSTLFALLFALFYLRSSLCPLLFARLFVLYFYAL